MLCNPYETELMHPANGQGELFINQSLGFESTNNSQGLKLSRQLIQDWQEKIHRHQSELFNSSGAIAMQQTLFQKSISTPLDHFAPLKLTPLTINFWRWPNSPHKGAAIYLVMDRPEQLDNPLLLYIGETSAADQRWKGEHDCKNYLSAYSEALVGAELKQQLSIRFWTDVPSQTPARRRLEQELIQSWLPPFNKETRARWATPFTTESK